MNYCFTSLLLNWENNLLEKGRARLMNCSLQLLLVFLSLFFSYLLLYLILESIFGFILLSILQNDTGCGFILLVSCLENTLVTLAAREIFCSYTIRSWLSAFCSMPLFASHSPTNFSSQTHTVEIDCNERLCGCSFILPMCNTAFPLFKCFSFKPLPLLSVIQWLCRACCPVPPMAPGSLCQNHGDAANFCHAQTCFPAILLSPSPVSDHTWHSYIAIEMVALRSELLNL